MIFNFSNILKSDNGKLILSILLGFGLSTLFRFSCKGKNCIIYNAPEIDDLKNKIYSFDNKCYVYTLNNMKCNDNKEIIKYA